MRDEVFIRGQVPMTKSEVRAVSLSKLELTPNAVLYDIGAGTGSVSVEAALAIPQGQVYAVEHNPEAAQLILANREKFGTENLFLVEGKAPSALVGLSVPTHGFIGGSSGEMNNIICRLQNLNPDIRIVINIIALETLTQTMDLLRTLKIEAEILLLQVAKAKQIGEYHLMQGQNPVYVISFGGKIDETGTP